MGFSLTDFVLWITNCILNLALAFVLLYKRRFRLVPWFTAFILWGLLYAISCFLAYRFASDEAYAVVYWAGAFVDIVLQITVVAEIAYLVMKPHASWADGARTAIFPFLIIGPVIAVLLATFMTPATDDALEGLAARASLFSTVVVCFMFVSVIRASQRLALDWRSHLAGESFGLTIWTLASFGTDTLHAYWRTMRHFEDVEHLHMLVYQLMLLYWCVVFWMPEPAPPEMPPGALQRYVERIGD